MSIPNSKVLWSLFGSALLFLAAIAATSYRSTVKFRETEGLVSLTYAVLSKLNELLSGVAAAEAGRRGFIITGSEDQLAQYATAIQEVPGKLATLRQLIIAPSQRRRLDDLEPLIQKRLSLLKESIDLRRAGRTDTIRQAELTVLGTASTEEIRSKVTEMETEEQRLLAIRSAESLRRYRITVAVVVFGSLFSFALLLLTFFLLNRQVIEQVRTEAKFRGLLESAPDAIVIVDSHGRILLVNDQTEKLFGYPREGLPGQAVEMLMPERYRGQHTGHRVQYFHSPQRRPMGAGLELYGRRKDGSEFPVEISLSPLQTKEGLVTISIIRDITEAKSATEKISRLNEDLQRRAVELEAANRELEAFTYSVSHDLRAPLRHVDGFSRILLEEYRDRMDREAQHYLDRVAEGAQQMGRLVDDLLNLSRIGRRELSQQPMDLNVLVQEVVDEFKRELNGPPVEWRLSPLSRMDCDPALMKLVFTNLLSNALKFTRDRRPAVIEVGEIPVNAERAVFIRDNGVGFDMKYVDKLFRAFQRLHRPEDFEGTGIGLATVQRIIQKHHGRIWAEAQPDHGATFYFTLGEN